MTAPVAPAIAPLHGLRVLAGAVVPPLLLSGAAMGICYATLRPTLGLVFAGFAVASLLSSSFAAEPAMLSSSRRGLLAQVAITLPILAAWVWGTFAGAWGPWAALQLAVLIVTYIASLSLTATALSRLIAGPLASALVTIAALAWLAWPIWTTDWMTEGLADRLVPISPLFAANAVTGLNPWPQHEVIYHLTRLGQDIPYALPNTVWPAALFHAAIGLAVVMVGRWVGKKG